MSKKPRVEEPEDIINPNSLFSGSFFGNNLMDKFAKHFEDFEKNFRELDCQNGFQEIKTFSSVKQFENGKIIKDESQSAHFRNNNGEGFVNIEKVKNGEKKSINRQFGQKQISN